MRLTKTQVNKFITQYCKENNIKRKDYALYPLYIHLNGFSHSIGFTSRKLKPHERATDYISVGYSAYTGGNSWGATNIHQQNIAITLLKTQPHHCYQNNAKEILF